MTQRGKFKLRKSGIDGELHLTPVEERKHSGKRRSLNKNKIYLNTPEDWYNYHSDDPRDVTSNYQRNGFSYRSLNEPLSPNNGRKIVYEKLFHNGVNKKTSKKGMIIGERPSLWNVSEVRRPELPGALFVKNLRQQKIDWKSYNTVTWNDILESHMKDVNRHRIIAQTLPQKEAWLASIDARVRHSKMNSDRELPHISPRLFNSKTSPAKPPQITKYISKDKFGNVFYIVGPSDVTKKEYRPYIFPEVVKAALPPLKLDF